VSKDFLGSRIFLTETSVLATNLESDGMFRERLGERFDAYLSGRAPHLCQNRSSSVMVEKLVGLVKIAVTVCFLALTVKIRKRYRHP
jgi:hypothetical protein